MEWNTPFRLAAVGMKFGLNQGISSLHQAVRKTSCYRTSCERLGEEKNSLIEAKFQYAIQLASWSQTSSRTSSRAG